MGKRKNWRKKFNSGIGRHSNKYKKEVRKFNEKIERYLQENRTTRFPRYRTVKRFELKNGKPSLRITVKRLHYTNCRFRLLKHNESGTKVSFLRQQSAIAEGFRVINLPSLSDYISGISLHFLQCKTNQSITGESPLSPLVEKNRIGLCSTLEMSCKSCKTTFKFTTSNTLPDSSQYEVNMRCVWGSMATGGGVSKLNELLATMGVPGMPQQQYSSLETRIGDLWIDLLQQDMIDAAAEERRLAIERKDFHQGVPAITVICDGGWSKRSHRHTYNALGGVAVIIGAATGKLLHIGVRNKYCYTCTTAESQQRQPKAHRCFKNWYSSSQAMEADIIVEGFQQAEQKYGIRYMRFIGDGDSSVHSHIQEQVPVWGCHVTKLECANHACKCLRSSLEKLVEDKPYYKGKGKLTKQVIVRLTKGVRCAIMMRSKESDRTVAIQKLRHDIQNSVYHVFGHHDRCSDFCKKRTDEKETTDTSPDLTEKDTSHILQDQQAMWEDLTGDDNMDEYRIGYAKPSGMERIDPDILRDVTILLNRLSSKCEKLLGNFTTNLAESWMAIWCKFDGGKLINRCGRGSWHSRCYGGALRKNFGPAWSPVVWQKVTKVRPGSTFTRHYKQHADHMLRSLKSKHKPEVKARAYKRKQSSARQSVSKRARREYGEDVLDVLTDLHADEMQRVCESYMSSHINISEAKIDEIEKSTRSQSYSPTWVEERKKRITSSSFGDVMSRSTKSNVRPIVKRLLYTSFGGNKYTRRGLQQEGVTIKEYIQRKKEEGRDVQVSTSGLVIDREHPFLACSPDGIVKEDTEKGLIEIKNLLQTTQMSLQTAAKKGNFCLEFKEGKLCLKKTHKYFYQCQGLLNICNIKWLDFIVRRTDPYQIHIQRIERDDQLWRQLMIPKLKAFYMKCILPELCSPRFKATTGIREPEKPWFDPTPGNPRRQSDSETSVTNDSKLSRTCKKTKRSKIHCQSTSHTQRGKTKRTNTETDERLDDPKQHPRSTGRPSRKCRSKFVGRKISHQWCTDEAAKTLEWYEGDVLECSEGVDGQAGAIYEVKYKGDTQIYSIDHLQEDFDSGALKFIDI